MPAIAAPEPKAIRHVPPGRDRTTSGREPSRRFMGCDRETDCYYVHHRIHAHRTLSTGRTRGSGRGGRFDDLSAGCHTVGDMPLLDGEGLGPAAGNSDVLEALIGLAEQGGSCRRDPGNCRVAAVNPTGRRDVRGSQMLGDFLTAMRRRLCRDDLGLPPTGGRRVGLRREEVAYLSAVSITWYTWLEQGRAATPSRQVLNALARTLRLSDAEHTYMLSLAGYTAPRRGTEPVHQVVPAGVRRFLDSMVDFPAYVIAQDWEFLAWNEAYSELYPGLSAVPAADRNLLWLLFTDPYLRDLMPDWELTVRSNVAAFRTEVGSGLSDPPFSDVVERLLEASESFRRVWENHPIEPLSSRTRVFRHPIAGELRYEQYNMRPSDHPGLHVVIYTPLPVTDPGIA
jgi:hypothetical protein